MKTRIVLFFILVLSLLNNRSYATHIAGGELSYTWISDSTYRINFKLYRDCSGVAQPTSLELCYKNVCDTNVYTLTLNPPVTINGGIPNGTPVNSSCPSYATTCNGGIFPNYAEWWYTGIITLPSRCSKWIFSVVQGARNPDNNLSPVVANADFYVEATLNNVIAQGNNSVEFTVKPEPFVCINQPYIYNNGAVDVDNDSLGYEVIQPEFANTICDTPTDIPFNSTIYNLYNNPMSSNNTFELDTITGEMHFTPNLLGNYTFALRVTEYRNQVPISSVIRDMQVHVISCNIAAPVITIDTTTVTLVNNRIQDCMGEPLHFCFTAKSTNPSAVLVPADNHYQSAPGSTVTYTNLYTDSIYGCFSWLPGANDGGVKNFNISVIDSSCNNPGVILANTYSIPLYILNGLVTTMDTSICAGASINLASNGGTSNTWSVMPGGSPLSSLSCTNCTSPAVTPSVTTAYVASSTGFTGCQNTDTVVVTVLPLPAVPAPTDNGPVCEYDSLQLFANTNAVAYNWTGPWGYTSTDQNPVIYFAGPVNEGTYYLSVMDSVCSSLPDSIYVQVLNAPTPVIIATGSQLQTDDTFSSYQWYLNDTAIAGATTDSCTMTQSGYYTVVVTNANGCNGASLPYVFNLGVHNLSMGTQLNIYPNPANTNIYIDAPILINIVLTDMEGRTLLQQINARQINISKLDAGIYMLKITDENGQLIRTEKVVKLGQ